MLSVILFLLALLGYIAVASKADESSACKWSEIIVSRTKSSSKEDTRKKILSIGPGKIDPGRLLCIIGPSGAGKSTFLNVVALRFQNSSVLNLRSDLVHRSRLNNVQFTKADVAFVQQDDAFFSMLTVNETLQLARLLKSVAAATEGMTTGMTIGISEGTSLLRKLNLVGIADSRVGDIDERGISGGERKRLSVALQLLGDPKFLVADEPTSGLDSFQATQVVQLLRNIAKEKNIPTICTIHQPSSNIWDLFDDVILLTPTGQLAYLGERKHILSYFESFGFKCPQHYNPAEFLIDLVSVDSSSREKRNESFERINAIAKHFESRNQIFQGEVNKASAYSSIAEKKTAGFKPFRAVGTAISSVRYSVIRFGLLLQRACRQVFRYFRCIRKLQGAFCGNIYE